MSSANLSSAFAGISGVVMAAGTNLAMNHWSSGNDAPSATAAEQHAAPEHAAPSQTVVVERDSDRLEALRREVEELRESREQRAGEGDRTLAISREENQRQHEAKFSGLERNFDEDPVDSSWSREGTDYLATGMASWGESSKSFTRRPFGASSMQA